MSSRKRYLKSIHARSSRRSTRNAVCFASITILFVCIVILKRIDNDIINDMLRTESRREERCKHELIEHPIPGGQETPRTSR